MIFLGFIGSYALIRGISLFAGHFPSEFTIIDLANKGEVEQISKFFTWRVYVYLASIAASTGISIIIQYKINKYYEEKESSREFPANDLLPSDTD